MLKLHSPLKALLPKNETWGQCDESFYGSHLFMNFRNKLELFQPSLIYAGKAGAYPSEAPFRCSTQGQAPCS